MTQFTGHHLNKPSVKINDLTVKQKLANIYFIADFGICIIYTAIKEKRSSPIIYLRNKYLKSSSIIFNVKSFFLCCCYFDINPYGQNNTLTHKTNLDLYTGVPVIFFTIYKFNCQQA